MDPIARKSDGRRIFTPEFKRQQIERLPRGGLTLSELSRELQISRHLLSRWKSLMSEAAETAVEANEDVVPASELKAAQQQIRESPAPDRQASGGVGDPAGRPRRSKKKTTFLRSVEEMTGRPLARIARVLGISRATAYRDRGPRASRYHRQDDALVYAQLKSVLRERGSYGYRRATVLVNRTFRTGYNKKRIQRVMRLSGLP